MPVTEVTTRTPVTTLHRVELTETQRWLLSPQARKVFDHMVKAGVITARDAMADYGMTSATLTRRICDLEEQGVEIDRVIREHPIHGTRYTRYSIARNRG